MGGGTKLVGRTGKMRQEVREGGGFEEQVCWSASVLHCQPELGHSERKSWRKRTQRSALELLTPFLRFPGEEARQKSQIRRPSTRIQLRGRRKRKREYKI